MMPSRYLPAQTIETLEQGVKYIHSYQFGGGGIGMEGGVLQIYFSR